MSKLPNKVLLVLPHCKPGFPEFATLLAILRIELRSDGVSQVDTLAEPTGPTRSLAVVHLQVNSCDPKPEDIGIRIDDSATHKRVERQVVLADVPQQSRSRVLALAIAELLRASWAELSTKPTPEQERELPTDFRETITVRLRESVHGEPSQKRFHNITKIERVRALEAYLAASVFPAYGGNLMGGRVAYSSAPLLSKYFGWRMDAGYSYGQAFDPLGDIDLKCGSVAASLLLIATGTNVRAELGPRLEIGWAQRDLPQEFSTVPAVVEWVCMNSP